MFGHVLLEVSVDKTIDVSAAGAADGTRLAHAHPTKWNAVHLEHKPTSNIIITLHRNKRLALCRQLTKCESCSLKNEFLFSEQFSRPICNAWFLTEINAYLVIS